MAILPSLFDPTVTYPIPQPVYMGTVGPYEHGGNLYWIALEQPSNLTLHLNIVCFKSTDGGVTFTRILPGTTLNNGGGVMSVTAPGGLDTNIYVAWRGTESGFQHGDLHTVLFDMATDTFGTVNDPGVTISSGSNPVIFFYKLPSGDQILVWEHSTTGSFTITARVWDGVSWSSDVVIASSASVIQSLRYALVDGAGNTGVFWDDSTTMFYTIVTGTTAGSPTTVMAIANISSNDFPYSAMYDAASDTIAYVIMQRIGLGDVTLDLILGTPSAAPTFTIKNVATDVGAALLWSTPLVAGNAAGNQFYIVVWPTSGVGGDIVNQQFTATTLNGSWTGPTTYYNETVNPPSPPPSNPDELVPAWMRVLSDGSLAVTVSMVYSIAGPVFCGVLVYLLPESPVSQTLTLVKVVSGGSSVESDWTLSADGPTPISGPGPTVGPSTVDPGDYTLSESGPSGYDASDWVISGGTATGPNTVTIAPGDTVVATITNTVQTPAPACPVDGSSGRVGVPYSATVTAGGGTPPYTFSIVAGALPPGLTLDPTTGIISGTPTTSGTYSYTIQVVGS